jgi:hypothetical protein
VPIAKIAVGGPFLNISAVFVNIFPNKKQQIIDKEKLRGESFAGKTASDFNIAKIFSRVTRIRQFDNQVDHSVEEKK